MKKHTSCSAQLEVCHITYSPMISTTQTHFLPQNLLQATAVLVNGSSYTVNTNAKMRILAIDRTPVTACPDTGLPVSFIERATLSKHFSYQQIQTLENGLTLRFQGLGGMAPAVNTFVDLPIICKTMKNSYMHFPPVRAYVVDSTPESVVLLGPNFIIPNALDFRWARKGGFAMHRLQIGDTENYIKLLTETTDGAGQSHVCACLSDGTWAHLVGTRATKFLPCNSPG
jgi:hypothetical protein